MTVCIAAICEWQNAFHVIGASDRMLTSGDVEFEPPTMKVWTFAHNIVGLASGEASAQAEICGRTQREILELGITGVGEAARIYGGHFENVRRERNATTFLSPLGLDVDTWVSRQHELAGPVVENLERSMTYEELDVEGIVCGVDTEGPHIYVITDPGVVNCEDSVGFAAVGIGANHADSQFMLAGYHFRETFPRSMFLTYAAKRKAEVAPGVGEPTDLFSVSLNGVSFAHQEIIMKLEEIYQANVIAEVAARETANKNTQEFVEVLIDEQRKQQDNVAREADTPAPTGDGQERVSSNDEEDG